MKEKVEIKVGEEKMRGNLYTPEGEGPFPGVVFYHGRGSSRRRYTGISKELSKNGVIALAFDFRGCGESDGVFEEQSQRMGIDDAREGLKFLLEQNVDSNRIGISGSSYGCFVAAIIMQEFDFVKSLVFRAPAVYPDELLDAHVSSLQDHAYIKREKWLESIAYNGIEHFKGDLLIIQSENDEVVHPWVVEEYYNRAVNASKREMFILKGAKHSLIPTPELFEKSNEVTLEWLLKTL